MLFAFILMRVFGVSANLMSLGAIDFGIVVDGSIVILEGILAHIYGRRLMGRTLSKEEMDAEVEKGAGNVVRSCHVCRSDYSDCVLPYIDFDWNRRKILYPDGQDTGVLYYRCSAAVADLCADDGFLVPEAYGIGKTDHWPTAFLRN